jgi:SH3 domain protein
VIALKQGEQMRNFRRGLQTTKKYWHIAFIVLLSNLLLSVTIQAKTFYVSDTTLTANVRTGPSFENRIIAMLQSGTKVTLVREEGGWSEVALDDGRRGWIPKNYLSDRPPWRDTAQKLASENQSLQTQVASLEQSQQSLSHENNKLRTELQNSSQKLDQLQRANKNMKTSYNLRWFLGGAGVLLTGWILGFWMGRMRRRSYSERYRL